MSRIQLLLVFLAFIFLTRTVKTAPYFPADLHVSIFLQQIHQNSFEYLMKFLTFLGSGLPSVMLVLTVTAIAFSLKDKLEALMFPISSASTALLGTLVKYLVGRTRPSPNMVHTFVIYTRSDSFPSGHVLFYLSIFGLIIYFVTVSKIAKFLKILAVIFSLSAIVLIGVSRIYLGAHWFSDIIGAYLLGIIWLNFILLIYQRLKTRRLWQK